jgi:hypothetical protein
MWKERARFGQQLCGEGKGKLKDFIVFHALVTIDIVHHHVNLRLTYIVFKIYEIQVLLRIAKKYESRIFSMEWSDIHMYVKVFKTV